MVDDKEQVRAFWDTQSCGEALLLAGTARDAYEAQRRRRYELEPFIPGFADFTGAKDLDVLEIGVGLGADHQSFAEAGARMRGIDLTERAVSHTRTRLQLFGLESDLRVADAEGLPFANESFDVVYAWGVLHHSPNTPGAVAEVHRVLRRGGVAKVMIYHKWSLIGFMLWVRYALMQGKPLRSLADVYSEHLESPGTKGYSVDQARLLFAEFCSFDAHVVLTHGDLLESGAGQRHRGMLLTVARAIWPRWLLRRVFRRNGLFMLITARK